jgi:hypothetical protein
MLPKILNCRFALISSLAVLGAVTFAPKASAQTNFPFEGDVTETCAFDAAPTQGVLVQATTTINNDTLTSTGGTASTADLTCNTTASNLTIAVPVANGAPATTLTLTASSATADGQDFNGAAVNLDTDGTTTAVVGIVNSVEFTVNMTFQADATIPAGTYNFNVPLTAAPN